MVATATVAAASLAMTPAAPATRKHKRKIHGVLVYRFTTRRHRTCRACKRHHRFMLFRTHALADAHRAHPGCNCPIVRHNMPVRQYRRLFGKRGAAPTGVVDLRKLRLNGKPRA
jgi:hypothetical protein